MRDVVHFILAVITGLCVSPAAVAESDGPGVKETQSWIGEKLHRYSNATVPNRIDGHLVGHTNYEVRVRFEGCVIEIQEKVYLINDGQKRFPPARYLVRLPIAHATGVTVVDYEKDSEETKPRKSISFNVDREEIYVELVRGDASRTEHQYYTQSYQMFFNEGVKDGLVPRINEALMHLAELRSDECSAEEPF